MARPKQDTPDIHCAWVDTARYSVLCMGCHHGTTGGPVRHEFYSLAQNDSLTPQLWPMYDMATRPAWLLQVFKTPTLQSSSPHAQPDALRRQHPFILRLALHPSSLLAANRKVASGGAQGPRGRSRRRVGRSRWRAGATPVS